MITTIISAISAAALIYLTASLERKKRITANDIIALFMSLTLFVVMVKSDSIFANDFKKSYNSGFHTAIQAADLIYADDNTYYIQFGNEVHEYNYR